MTDEERKNYLNGPIHWDSAAAAFDKMGHKITANQLKQYCSERDIKTVSQMSSILFEIIDYFKTWN